VIKVLSVVVLMFASAASPQAAPRPIDVAFTFSTGDWVFCTAMGPFAAGPGSSRNQYLSPVFNFPNSDLELGRNFHAWLVSTGRKLNSAVTCARNDSQASAERMRQEIIFQAPTIERQTGTKLVYIPTPPASILAASRTGRRAANLSDVIGAWGAGDCAKAITIGSDGSLKNEQDFNRISIERGMLTLIGPRKSAIGHAQVGGDKLVLSFIQGPRTVLTRCKP